AAGERGRLFVRLRPRDPRAERATPHTRHLREEVAPAPGNGARHDRGRETSWLAEEPACQRRVLTLRPEWAGRKHVRASIRAGGQEGPRRYGAQVLLLWALTASTRHDLAHDIGVHADARALMRVSRGAFHL